MSTPSIQTRKWTRQEYERMADTGLFDPEERLELLDGEILIMAPQHSPHAVAVGKTLEALRAAFPTGYWVRIQMPLIIDPDSEPEPDVAVVAGSFDDYLHEHPRTAVLVVEVADTSLKRDRDRKPFLYARAGISEYWIVNLQDRRLEVYREPVAPEGQPAQYHVSFHLGPAESVSPLAHPDTSFPVSDLLP